MHPEDLIVIAEVVKPRGVHGELKAIPCTDFPDRFCRLHRVFVRNEDGSQLRSLIVRGTRFQREALLISFEGVHTMEEAQRLCGGQILIPRDEVIPLPAGEYYVFDLIGLEAVDLEGRRIGRVIDVLSLHAHDIYVVQDGEHEILLPAVREIIREIDVGAGRMTVTPPEGLVEMYRGAF